MNDMMDIDKLLKAAATGQPVAQYQLGEYYFSRGEIENSIDWLTRAAENDLPNAQNLLGFIYLNGIGTICQTRKALDLFRAAAAHDLKEAHYNLAGLLYCGSIIQNDDRTAYKHIIRAAELNHRPALRVLGYLYGATGDIKYQKLATKYLATAAYLGDIHSEYALGACYMEGVGVERNINEGVFWMARAANKNLYCAGKRLKFLISENGVEKIQHMIQKHVPVAKRLTNDAMELYEPDIVHKIKKSNIPKNKFVSQYPQFIKDNLCDYIVNLAAPRLTPSGVVDPNTGKPLKTKQRTSSSMNYPLSMYDMAIGFVCRRLAAQVDMPASHAEPISVLRYLPGEEYRPHYDYFNMDQHGKPQVQDTNGQRTVTVFIYLNKVDEGGETEFPRLAVKVFPEKGKAVAFLNCDTQGQPDPDTLHAGLPVTRGEKWLATLWFREKPFIWI
jgi:prolyl 4-hydroxylase